MECPRSAIEDWRGSCSLTDMAIHRNVRLCLLAMLASPLSTGCGPRPGAVADLAPITLSPADSAPGRHETVLLQGTTGFTAGTPITASFGDGITATAVVESADRIVAALTIDPAAAQGSRDVVLVQDNYGVGGLVGVC